ncbi:hypothetical protein [Anaeromyxobacter oryzae]|uniref:Uncharacterized protein n=1 Tax=Anaeromyxobacter oryzae TaxID=2918170 RepID=A0ABN6MXH5_9BACT|nr:hypothetical protein [Anaeromyxobacter oryzae]BDG05664.1 hypothetical protein AMOR_46600 [Anaeromyxobacter oryzae]
MKTIEPQPNDTPETASGLDSPAQPTRPAYEPPRIVKKRSVSRATLFSGSGAGPDPRGGLVGSG